MRIGQDHEKLSSLSRNFGVEVLSSGKVPAWITWALERSGRLKVRKSPLQPRIVFWLVVGMMLWRNESIPAVFGLLISGIRGRVGDLSLRPVTEGALTHARRRLGVRPFRLFFRKLGEEVQPPPSFRGHRVWAIDGTRLSVLDTPENLRVFGRRKVHRGRAAFCELSMVCLVDAARHMVRDAVFGLWDASELRGARRLLSHVAAHDLVILDRFFFGLPFFQEILAHGAHFLCRVSGQPRLQAIPGTRQRHQYEAWMTRRVPWEPGDVRTGWGTMKTVRLRVRVIDYRLRGH